MKLKDIIPFISGAIVDLYPERESNNIAILVAMHLGFNRTYIALNGGDEINGVTLEQVRTIADKLAAGTPVQYVLGHTEFYGIKFVVNQSVLIPRPETEEMVDLIIKENANRKLRILDAGTGSGCIAICLAKSFPDSEIFATDTSRSALETAGLNAAGNDAKVKFLMDDMLNTSLNNRISFDIIVSNPPYVTESERLLMRKNVTDFEPDEALYVRDEDPLIYYRALARTGINLLKEGGLIYLEINERFGNEVSNLLYNTGYDNVQVLKDINNKDRIAKAAVSK